MGRLFDRKYNPPKVRGLWRDVGSISNGMAQQAQWESEQILKTMRQLPNATPESIAAIRTLTEKIYTLCRQRASCVHAFVNEYGGAHGVGYFYPEGHDKADRDLFEKRLRDDHKLFLRQLDTPEKTASAKPLLVARKVLDKEIVDALEELRSFRIELERQLERMQREHERLIVSPSSAAIAAAAPELVSAEQERMKARDEVAVIVAGLSAVFGASDELAPADELPSASSNLEL